MKELFNMLNLTDIILTVINAWCEIQNTYRHTCMPPLCTCYSTLCVLVDRRLLPPPYSTRRHKL